MFLKSVRSLCLCFSDRGSAVMDWWKVGLGLIIWCLISNVIYITYQEKTLTRIYISTKQLLATGESCIYQDTAAC